ncbi:MAG TPA: toprim domain-containing protein [Verrucomicrobiae bacterium]|jgi:DNA primase|nr:toprim domain-containing protein [Verrucomicrobiae bacterium]
MPKSSFVDFKAVKAALKMEQVLEHYGILDTFKGLGDSLSGPCPIHKGTNPTQFRVSISKNIWNCFSECKHGGNVLDFIARMENVSIHAAAVKAIEWFSLDSEVMTGKSDGDEQEAPPARPKVSSSRPSAKVSSKPEPEKLTPNKPLKFRLEKLDHNHPYLAERGLTQETIIDFGIGFCAKGMMADRIAIPIHNSAGDVVAYAGRSPGEPAEDNPKYKLPQGFRKSLELFNIDRAIKEPANQPLVIVEGFFDCMKLHQLGCRKVVALMGSTMSAVQEEIIRKYTNRNAQIIVMLDEDEAGWEGREDIAVRLVKYAFIKIHMFRKENMQPDQLTAEELDEIRSCA